MKTIKATISIALAVLMFLCLTRMPYGYYQFVRLAALIGFAVLCYDSYKAGNFPLVILYAGLAILFQPFAKFYIHRDAWHIIDVVVGLLLVGITAFDLGQASKSK